LAALRHHHAFNAAVVLHDLEQLPLLRLPQQARHVARLAIPHFDDDDTIVRQILRSFGKQTSVKQETIAPTIERFTRLITVHRDRQRRELLGGDVGGIGE
jgi:hypothetical protein